MSNVKVTVDTRGLNDIEAQYRRAGVEGLYRAAERGQRYLRREIPKVTHNLEHGVTYTVNSDALTAELVVSARRGQTGARAAEVHHPSGKTKSIKLRPQAAFDYAEVVATGRPRLTAPKSAKAFLVPVLTAPSNESYITEGSRIFVTRRSIDAVPANPYHERAAEQLSRELPAIYDAALAKVLG